jgi:hypothetical protein
MADASYNTKNYRTQGGTQTVIGPGGSLLLQGSVIGGNPGGTYFVSSVAGSSSNDGLSFSSPKATLAQALALCTASNGDTIYLMPGHAESVGASGLAWNVAGVSIIGLGSGNLRPTFTWHTTDAVVTISAANTLVQNIRTTVDLDEVVSMFLVTGAGVTLDTVDFIDAGSTQAIQWLLTTAAADQLTIKNCFHVQNTAAGSAQKWIQLVGTDHTRILDNTFILTANASTSSNLISGSTAVVNCEIGRNKGCWLGATITIVINLVTTSTGVLYDNRFFTGTSVATAAAYTCDACAFFDNKFHDTVSTSGLLAPLVDTDT